MSKKVHFLNSHLDKFPENLCDISDEQGERFHQDMERYQGRWDTLLMARVTPMYRYRPYRPLFKLSVSADTGLETDTDTSLNYWFLKK